MREHWKDNKLELQREKLLECMLVLMSDLL